MKAQRGAARRLGAAGRRRGGGTRTEITMLRPGLGGRELVGSIRDFSRDHGALGSWMTLGPL